MKLFKQKNIAEHLLQSFNEHSNYPALNILDNTYTYQELGHEVGKLANCIKFLPVHAKRIGILGYRSKTIYVAVLASLFSGCTYVPLNKNFPLDRNISICLQTELDIIIADESELDYLNQLLEKLNKKPLVIIPNNTLVNKPKNFYDQSDVFIFPNSFPEMDSDQEKTAYILFTSGSTGHPKGVPISHKNILHFMHYNQKKYRISSSDRLSQTFDQTFDLSIFDMFMAWLHGACLYVLQPLDLLSPSVFINKHKITLWFSVPSIINLARKKHLLLPNSLPTLRLSLFCGEALSVDSLMYWQAAAPNSIIDNLYGPTELTIACTAYRCKHSNSKNDSINGIVSIGKPYKNLEILIVDNNLNPVKPQNSGELCVAGSQLFSGYLNDRKKTKSVFFYHRKKRFYRTGDKVQLSKNGNILYLGRTDQQIKVNGYRIELSEIEYHLRSYQGVIEAAALGWPEQENYCSGIIAFVTGKISNTDQYMAYLRTKLPSYMIPSHINVVDNIPLNANGKINKHALKLLLNKSAKGDVI